MIVHEGQPLLIAGRSLQGSLGPGGRIQVLAEEESPMKKKCRACSFLVLFGLILLACSIFKTLHRRPDKVQNAKEFKENWKLHCGDDILCFERETVRVLEGQPSFPSFWDYAPHGPISVSYDERALLLNGTRSLFISGSMHPARSTPSSWSNALDEAVRHGLNMITIYVFWASHQPFEGAEMDWSLPGRTCDKFGDGIDEATISCGWTLASAIRAAANRGLFIHARIGPYVCAEYSYGGIPEWVPLNRPEMSMRRPNKSWMDAMEIYVQSTIEYLTKEKLWAYQGGPIIMGQIENELGGEVDAETENLITIEACDKMSRISSSCRLRNATLQDYADWSGEIAAKYAPKVLWTMCNGLTAPNAINTCNGYGGASCSDGWLESYGQSGRIQVDQPALWTENEAGFQVWGETADKPTDYFWGRTARSGAKDALKWFARGGTHLNYYMWAGFYNRGRSAAAGITNMYASDASGLCPSGQRHQPTFGHFRSLHWAITDIAPILLAAPSSLGKNKSVDVLNSDGLWQTATDQRMFAYVTEINEDEQREISFVENDDDDAVVIRIKFRNTTRIFEMAGNSGAVLVNGILIFDSATVNPRAMAYKRVIHSNPVQLLDWSSWKEPVGAHFNDHRNLKADHPIEQTELMHVSHASSDFAWFETDFFLKEDVARGALISIECQMASAFSCFIDGEYLGTVDHHLHKEGNITLALTIGQDIHRGSHTLSLLSESLGYGNLIGRWGASTKAKTKGITGNVFIVGASTTGRNFTHGLVDGREWRSFPGLHGEYKNGHHNIGFLHRPELQDISSAPCVWSRAVFDTPSFDVTDVSLFLDITSGRGRLWLNGHDLGRFWNITKGDTRNYSQRYYFLPHEFLSSNGNLNELLIFNSLGGDTTSTKLVVSGIVEDENGNFQDQVDFPGACL